MRMSRFAVDFLKDFCCEGLSELSVNNPPWCHFFPFMQLCNTCTSAGVYCCTTRGGNGGTMPEFEVLGMTHLGLSMCV